MSKYTLVIGRVGAAAPPKLPLGTSVASATVLRGACTVQYGMDIRERQPTYSHRHVRMCLINRTAAYSGSNFSDTCTAYMQFPQLYIRCMADPRDSA